MKKPTVYGLIVAVLLVAGTAGSVWAQYGAGSGQIATPEQIKECKQLGVPEVICTETSLLAKRRMVAAGQTGAYGSGTSMISKTFGEMGMVLGALAAIFGVVAIVFFAKSRVGKEAETK